MRITTILHLWTIHSILSHICFSLVNWTPFELLNGLQKAFGILTGDSTLNLVSDSSRKDVLLFDNSDTSLATVYDNWSLLDIVLVATVEGDLIALHRSNGDVLWKIKGHNDSFLNFYSVPDTKNDLNRKLKDPSVYWLFEPMEDGQLFTFSPESGIRDSKLTVREIISSSPLYSIDQDRTFLGKQSSSLLTIDVLKGTLINEIDVNKQIQVYQSNSSALTLNTYEVQPYHPIEEDTMIMDLGRTEYSLFITDKASPSWSGKFTKFAPNLEAKLFEPLRNEPKDGWFYMALHDGQLISHRSLSKERYQVRWATTLGSPVLQIFDLYQVSDNLSLHVKKVVAIPHPRPTMDFSELFIKPYESEEMKDLKFAFVNLTKTNQPYVLSEAFFPLIRNGSLALWYFVPQHLRQTLIQNTFYLIGKHPIEFPELHPHVPSLDPPASFPVHQAQTQASHKSYWGMFRSYIFPIADAVVLLFCCSIIFGYYNKYSMQILEMILKNVWTQDMFQFNLNELEEISFEDLTEKVSEKNSNDEKAMDAEPLNVTGMKDTGELAKRFKKRRGARGKKNRKKSQSNDNENSGQISNEEDFDEQGYLVINNLTISSEILGSGSNGTFVFKGRWEGRDIAVKRMLNECIQVAAHEVSLLQQSDEHPNIVRYYCTQYTPTFIYMALELCICSLHDWVENKVLQQQKIFPATLDPKRALHEIASGIEYIHSLKLVHRDLKPGNILIAFPKQKTSPIEVSNKLSIRISDLGLSKKLDLNQSSFGVTTLHAAGTTGWRAPELLANSIYKHPNSTDESDTSTNTRLDNSQRITQAIDIFAMGCIFYYLLTDGQHPFGSQFVRENNILKGEKDLSHLMATYEDDFLALDLINSMLSHDSSNRPTSKEILLHPFFWSSSRKLSFLMEVSDRFELEPRDPESELVKAFESNAFEIVGIDYQKKLDKCLLENLGKYRKYNGSKVLDLLRVLRNKRHHYLDLPQHVQSLLGSLPDGFSEYFRLRFPLLLLHSWQFAKSNFRTEFAFQEYFGLNQI